MTKINVNFLEPSRQQLNNLLELYQAKKYDDAEKLAASLTEKFPTHAFPWKVLGAVLKKTGKINEALIPMQRSVQLSPQDAEAHSNLGVILKELGRLKEAEANYRKAIILKPDYAEAHSNLGITLQEQGRLEEAETNLGKAITLKPDFAEAHRHLTVLKKFYTQDQQYLKMQELLLSKNISEEERCNINFGLAKASEDLEDFEQAFQHYREGNEQRKKLLNYDMIQDIELFKQLKSSYPRIEQNSLEVDNLANKLMPIFIVGMPRSGTTLVEQIISSHPQVTGAGELSFADHFGKSIAIGSSAIDKDSILNFRVKYLTKLKNISNGNLIVTDKMPQNFRYIGLLAAAFPEAKIVHVKRNPAAVCWSNYKQYFANKNLSYSYGLGDTISYHKLYENLMQFWGNLLGKRIYNLDYEMLTEDQENETRKLINYISLNWEEKCLYPQDNMRPVHTASDIQVRKKIYQGSSQQWGKYKPFLNGALDCFENLKVT